MCCPVDSRPPIPPIRGASVDFRDQTLRSSDGAPVASFAARPDSPSGAGVVILPHVRGLVPFFEELALRFAEEGINAIAIDYYGRTAGAAKRDFEFDFRTHNLQVKAEELNADVAAAVAFLRSPEGGSCESVFTLGFCFGGGLSWLQAATDLRLQGVIGMYGVLGTGPGGGAGAIERARDFNCPVLALQGGADDAVTPEQSERFRSALSSAGVENEVVVYPGAPHGFFDGAHERIAPDADKVAIAKAAADAWPRLRAFIREHGRERTAVSRQR